MKAQVTIFDETRQEVIQLESKDAEIVVYSDPVKI